MENKVPRSVEDTDILNFIREITPHEEDVFSAAEDHCRGDDVPILSEELQSLLAVLLQMHQPRRILEVGTAYGFSALFMSRFLPEDGELDTIERNPVMYREARMHLEAADPLHRIHLHTGQASDLLPRMKGPYDFVLLDAAIGQYPLFWELIEPLLAPRAVILADNVLHGGSVAKDRFEVPRRQRTIHARMRDFLRERLEDPAYRTSLLSIGDGVLIAVRKQVGKEL